MEALSTIGFPCQHHSVASVDEFASRAIPLFSIIPTPGVQRTLRQPIASILFLE